MKHPKLFGLITLATAMVAQSATLPEGYTALDFIQATSGGKQWILTDMTPTCTDTVEMKVLFTDKNNTQALFCSRGTSTSTATFTAFLLSGKIRMDRNTKTSNTTTFEPGVEKARTFVFNYKDYSATMDGTSWSTTVDNDFTPGSKITLFASHTAGTGLSKSTYMGNYGTYRLFYFVLKDSEGKVKLNLVPAKDSNDVIGLYDTVSAKFHSSMSATAFNGGIIENASWTDEDDDKRVLTVPEYTTYEMTSDDVTTLVSSGRNFIIRGKGTVHGVVALTGFTKDIVIESGIFSMQVKDCFGPNAGSVTVKKGAAISIDKAIANMMSLKKVYFEGTGPDGKGAILAKADLWSAFRNSNWNGPHNEFYMTGDAKIYQYNRIDYVSFIDTCGYDLEIEGQTWAGFGTDYITNSSATVSHVTDRNGKLMLAQSNNNPLRGSADNVLSITGKGAYYTQCAVPNSWTIDFQNGSSLDAHYWVANGADASLSTCRFSGPVNFSGVTHVTTATNCVATLAGPVSGSGTINVDGGWLNLDSDSVTYTGSISVASMSGHGPTSRAGLGLRKTTPLPLTALSFADADLLLSDAYAAALPNLTFGGTGTNTLSGAALSGTRIEGAGVLVTNGAVVEISSPLTVTGKTEIANGTLRIPSASPLVGNAGLMGYADRSSGMLWWFSLPTKQEIAANYTNYYPHGTDLMTAQSTGTGARNYRHHGYIWNRSATNETWSFWANFNDRAFVWMDGKTVFINVASYDSADKRCKTITDVTPGAHEIIMIFTASDGSSGPQWLSSEAGYCAMALDRHGRGITNNVSAYYEPVIDPGDGSLLTTDNSTTVSDSRWLPSFDNVAFGANGVLDCGHHDLAVGSLTGFGSVTNATTLTIAEKFVLKVTDAASAPLTVDGTLDFATDAAVDFDSYEEPSAELKEAIREGVVVAKATAITGKPTIRPWLKSAGYRVRKQGNELILTTAKGLRVIVR